MAENTREKENVDPSVVNDFGFEWTKFNQRDLSDDELAMMFKSYFGIFPWTSLPDQSVGFDAGCGTGRWASLVAPRVGHLYCIDPSAAIEVAKEQLSEFRNCTFYRSTIDNMPIADGSMDFGYSIGVLHHLPDTRKGLVRCVSKLKSGAPFLVYIYYAFDNRPGWFRFIWKVSDLLRRLISKSPYRVKFLITQAIAFFVYFPLAKTAKFLSLLGFDTQHFPLNAYKDRSFYSMRTDALDRFGTRLERRFTRQEIENMMDEAGLEKITFSSDVPFWCAVGFRV